MEKVSKVISRVFKNEKTSSYGTMYNFDVKLENGDSGFFSSTKREPSSFVEGQEQKYTLEVKSGNSNGKDWSFNKLSPVKENKFGFGGGAKKDPFTQALILAQSSFAKSIDLVVAGKIEMAQLQAAAEKIMKQQIESALKFKEEIKSEEVLESDLKINSEVEVKEIEKIETQNLDNIKILNNNLNDVYVTPKQLERALPGKIQKLKHKASNIRLVACTV